MGPIPPGGCAAAKPPLLIRRRRGISLFCCSVLPALAGPRRTSKECAAARRAGRPSGCPARLMRSPRPALARVPRAASAPARRARRRCRGPGPAVYALAAIAAPRGRAPAGAPRLFCSAACARYRAPRALAAPAVPSLAIRFAAAFLRSALLLSGAGRFLAWVAGSPLGRPLCGFGPGGSCPRGVGARCAPFFAPPRGPLCARVLRPLRSGCVCPGRLWCAMGIPFPFPVSPSPRKGKGAGPNGRACGPPRPAAAAPPGVARFDTSVQPALHNYTGQSRPSLRRTVSVVRP